MNIGIVTFSQSNDNYGEVLQCYALYKYVQSKGHHCFLLRYEQMPYTNFALKAFTLLSLITNPQRLFSLLKKRRGKMIPHATDNTDRKFFEFRSKKMECTAPLTKNEILENPPKADAYICGSDQIWASPDPIMYLSFAPKDSIKCAFAPSFGGLTPNAYARLLIRKYIKDFDFVSCREMSGVKLCRELGREDTCLFPDPTLMHNASFYSQIAQEPPVSDKYILLYMLGNKSEFEIQAVYDFAHKEGLKVIYITGQNRVENYYSTTNATIEEWLGLIKGAEYVITNSFHGTVFSLINHKKFLTIPLVGAYERMNVRIHDLLSKFKLNNRLYRDSLSPIKESIDFEYFDKEQQRLIAYVDQKLKILRQS